MIGHSIRNGLATLAAVATMSLGLATTANATIFPVVGGVDVPAGNFSAIRVTLKVQGEALILPDEITLPAGFEGFGSETFNGPVVSVLTEINEDFPPPIFGGETYLWYYNFELLKVAKDTYQVRFPSLDYRNVLPDGYVFRSDVLGYSLQGFFKSDNNITFSVTTEGVPEPATWALTILGFGAIGLALRRRAPSMGQASLN